MPSLIAAIFDRNKTVATLLGVVISSVCGFAVDRKVSVVLVGDSTVAEWSEQKPARGWGQFLPAWLGDHVQLTNLAVCGASTKTFPGTGNWQRALEMKPDFILIQFGHNDSHAPDKLESTKAETEFTENLERFVLESRSAGSVPVLVTPVHRRMFDSEGRPTGELEPYAVAVRGVAARMNVPLIDLYQSSGNLLARLGESGSKGLTVSDQDRTHFTSEGASSIAGLVAQGLRENSPGLACLVRGTPPP